MTERWAIGIYTGKSPFELSPAKGVKNPVLTYKDVNDVPARFVADPFMIKEGDTWFLFFEVLNMRKNSGDIALATSSDAIHWTYSRIVLDEKFHLSYPYVFKFKEEFYMIPETFEADSIRLYRAAEFPVKWEYVRNLAEGRPFVDSSIIYFSGRWWLFASSTTCDVLYLYHADELAGPWLEHPMSPVVRNNDHIARPGGRIIVFGGRAIRFAQDDHGCYGKQLLAFEIIELTTHKYKETAIAANPVLGASGKASDWNGMAMHHADIHETGKGWIACVDGKGEYKGLKIGNRCFFYG